MKNINQYDLLKNSDFIIKNDYKIKMNKIKKLYHLRESLLTWEKEIGIDNLSYSYKSNLRNKSNIFITDISDTKKLNTLFRKFKITKVIHTAAFSYVMEAEKDKKKYFENNIIKTKKFIDLCKKKSVEDFIFLSPLTTTDSL